METYIIYAHTTNYGWSFEGEKPEKLTKYRGTGLCYIFEASSYEEAVKEADRFVFYFEQEYVGEDNVTETYQEEGE